MLKDTIKKLRTEQGLSQDELAERIHVVRQTVSKWERGTSVPDADSLVALARALGASAAELLGESTMAEKEPNELAWETSLLDERITSESQRLDRLVRSLKWALIGAAAAAFAVSPSLAAWLQGNDTLVNTLMYYTDAGSRIKDLDLSLLTVSQVTQGALTQIMAGAQLPEQFQAAFINAVNTAPGATTMATLLSQTIVNVSLSILSFLICFLGCYIVATFVIHLICYVFELPVLRHLDALMGGVFGLARGVLLLFILFALVPIIQAVVPVQQLTDILNASRLAPLFDSKLILSILGA